MERVCSRARSPNQGQTSPQERTSSPVHDFLADGGRSAATTETDPPEEVDDTLVERVIAIAGDHATGLRDFEDLTASMRLKQQWAELVPQAVSERH